MEIRQAGFALIAAVILIVVAAVMAVVLATLVSSSTQSGAMHIGSAQSLFAAEVGLERGLYERNRNAWDCATPASQTGTVGSGGSSAGYSVTCTSYSASTTLSAAVSNSVQTIPVASIASLAPFGRVTVESEQLDYDGTSSTTCGAFTPPCLTGVSRGTSGTTAAAHGSGVPVSQNHIVMTSVGTQSGANTTRTLQRVIFTSNLGWTVGNAGGGATNRPLIFQWNGTAWVSNNSSLNINEDLRGVYCLSANDCWAVGNAGTGATQRPFILHWNGSAWSTLNSSLNINEDLRAIHCVAANDCWAVGDPGTGVTQRPLILHWNGTAWSTLNSSLNINLGLRGIHCRASNDCWAVGEEGSGPSQRPFILRWNGTAWSSYDTSAINVDKRLDAIYCAASSDCWAVGQRGGAGARPFIVRWNGTAWSRYDTTALNINRDLNAVTCAASNDCWAVGDGDTIIRWNGTTWATAGSSGTAQNLNGIFIFGGGGSGGSAVLWRESFP
jgi:hypothetical protein